MCMVAPDRTILQINRMAEELFGYQSHELIGQPIEILVPKALRQDHPSHVSAFQANPANRAMGSGRELFGQRKDGALVPVEIGLKPIVLPGGVFTLAAIIDITERKRLEDELRRSNAELEHFAYVTSHDLQEPLRAITSYIDLLSQRYHGQLDEKADKYIDFVAHGARRMQQMIVNLLSYSRVGSPKQTFKVVETESIVSDVLELYSDRLREIQATVLVHHLPAVMGNEGELRRLFQNLIGNAIKFHGAAPLQITISAEKERLNWRFSIRDNGIGIDMQYADRIFTMFHRLHQEEKYDGSGIGLAISKRIVESHGGKIGFHSTPGGGAIFYFTLPDQRGAEGSVEARV